MRAPTGTRIEETAALCDRVEAVIREQIPQSELVSMIDNIGLPYSSINLSYSNSAPIGTGDADILAELSKDHHPTAEYVHDLRIEAGQGFSRRHFLFLARGHRQPDSEFRPSRSDRYSNRRTRSGGQPRVCGQLAEPAEIRSRHGGPADPAGLQPAQTAHRRGPHQSAADRLLRARRRQQPADFAQRQFSDVAHLLARSATGVSYSIATQTPQYRADSLQDLENIPGHRPRHAAIRKLWPAWLPSAAARKWAWSRTTTSCR